MKSQKYEILRNNEISKKAKTQNFQTSKISELNQCQCQAMSV